jgi:nicotinate-nucleotide pyrophosphorylase (carboxylating)
VCGGWKKLPAQLKPLLRVGLDAAGVGHRLLPGDFLYLDKNAVAMLGGVGPAVAAGRRMAVGPVAVQVKERADLVKAAQAGCGAVMVDSGALADLAFAADVLRRYPDVVLAFGGGVGLEHLASAHALGASVVDVGRGILSSPLLDLRVDVVPGADSKIVI